MPSLQKLWNNMATSLPTAASEYDSLAHRSHCELRSKLSVIKCGISNVSRGDICCCEISGFMVVLFTLYPRPVVNPRFVFVNVASPIVHNVIIVDLGPAIRDGLKAQYETRTLNSPPSPLRL